MYDMPHAAAAYDRFWAAIRADLGTGPSDLSRDVDPWAVWPSPDLLLAQTCGLPYRARLFDDVTLVGTPDYGLRDCPRGYYFSYVIKRRGDARNLTTLARSGTLAYNEPLSQSGWAAPFAHLAGKGMHANATLQTGAHRASAEAVVDQRADYAAIDAITFQMWNSAAPDLCAGLDAFVRTKPTPGLPFITAKGRDPAPIARAVTRAIEGLDPADRDVLMLQGLEQIDADTYRALPIPPMP